MWDIWSDDQAVTGPKNMDNFVYRECDPAAQDYGGLLLRVGMSRENCPRGVHIANDCALLALERLSGHARPNFLDRDM